MWQRCRVFLRRVQRVLSRLVSILLHATGQLVQVLCGMLILFACVLLVGPCLALLLLWECLSPFLFGEDEEPRLVSLSPISTSKSAVVPEQTSPDLAFGDYYRDWALFCRTTLTDNRQPSRAATRKIYRALHEGTEDRIEEETAP